MRILAALTTALVVALTGAAQAAPPAVAATAADEPVPGKLLLMLDASGSMKAKDPSGLTKIEAAKKALTGVVGALPDTAQVGLRVYGAKVDGGGKPTPAACADTQLIHPIAALDKAKLTTTIAAIKALGETPIAHSLEEAMKDLGATGKRNIVLVSDGEESCVPDPCPAVKKLTAAGVDLQIDTVGFGVNAKARTQLQCIAEAGKGTYYDAKDAGALTTSLSKLSTRATRPFAFSGTPVVGMDVPDNSTVPPGAPALTPGQFTDALTSSDDLWRAYRIKRSLPESTLHVAFTVKPTSWRAAGEDTDSLESLYLRVIADDGTECVDTSNFTGDGLGIRPAASVVARILGQSPTTAAGDDAVCRGVGSFTVLVRREGALPTTPVEISVIEEPRVADPANLPPAVDGYPDDIELPKGVERPVTGGLAFSDAPEITGGTWVDTFVPGETLVYRIKVEDGQTVRFTANGPTGGFVYPDLLGLDVLWVDGRAYAPDRQDLGNSSSKAGSFARAFGSSPKSVTSAQISYTNRYIKEPAPENIRASSMGGWVYYAVGVGTTDLGKKLAGQPIKIAFTAKVDGMPSNAVKYDQAMPNDPHATPSTDGQAQAGQDSETLRQGTNPLLWVGLGLVALLGALGAAYTVARSRLRGRTTNDGDLR